MMMILRSVFDFIETSNLLLFATAPMFRLCSAAFSYEMQWPFNGHHVERVTLLTQLL
jgi:hypothetical protein